jgi:Reverse transcriptase (RNA-dependent DNA polymerase)
MFAVLEHFGFGQDFINWVKLLYNNIGSRIYVNRFLTDIFAVTRSMRQGCGLSPRLYVLSIEVLAPKIRSSMIYKGIMFYVTWNFN